MSETDKLNKRTREIKELMKHLDARKGNLSDFRIGQKNPFDTIAGEEKALFEEYCRLPEYLEPVKFRRLNCYESLDGRTMLIMKGGSAIIKTDNLYEYRIEVKDGVPVAKIDKFVDPYVRQQRKTIQPIVILSDAEIGRLEDAEAAKIAARPKSESRRDIPTWKCQKCGRENLDESLVQNCMRCHSPRPKEESKSEGKLSQIRSLLNREEK